MEKVWLQSGIKTRSLLSTLERFKGRTNDSKTETTKQGLRPSVVPLLYIPPSHAIHLDVIACSHIRRWIPEPWWIVSIACPRDNCKRKETVDEASWNGYTVYSFNSTPQL